MTILSINLLDNNKINKEPSYNINNNDYSVYSINEPFIF